MVQAVVKKIMRKEDKPPETRSDDELRGLLRAKWEENIQVRQGCVRDGRRGRRSLWSFCGVVRYFANANDWSRRKNALTWVNDTTLSQREKRSRLRRSDQSCLRRISGTTGGLDLCATRRPSGGGAMGYVEDCVRSPTVVDYCSRAPALGRSMQNFYQVPRGRVLSQSKLPLSR